MNITAEDRDIMRDPHEITTTTPPSDAAIAKDAARLIEMAMHSWREIHAHIEEMEKTGPDGLRGVTAAVSVIDLFNWNSVLAALASYVRRAAAPPAEAPGERGDAIRKEVEAAIADHCNGADLWLASKLAADKIAAQLAAAPAAPAPDTAGECCDTPSYCSSVRRCTAKDEAPRVTGGRELPGWDSTVREIVRATKVRAGTDTVSIGIWLGFERPTFSGLIANTVDDFRALQAATGGEG